MQTNDPTPPAETPTDDPPVRDTELDAAAKKAGENLDKFEDEVDKEAKKGHENDPPDKAA